MDLEFGEYYPLKCKILKAFYRVVSERSYNNQKSRSFLKAALKTKSFKIYTFN